MSTQPRGFGRVFGKLTSEWVLEDGTFNYSVTVPPNTTATVYLPMDGTTTLNGETVSGMKHTLNAEQYEFTIQIQSLAKEINE